MSKEVDKVVEIVFMPTEEMKEVKAAFLVRIKDNPTVNLETTSLAAVQQIVDDWRLEKWWRLDGFKEWFCNRDSWREKLEYILDVGLDEMFNVLTDKDAAAAAKVRAFEIVSRLAGREPAKVREIKMLDGEIDKMDERQLSEFVKKNIKLINS